MKKNVGQHIILVSIDTLRADCINASPRAQQYLNQYKTNVSLKTDCLDTLLNSGIYFNNCYSAAPYTSASHAAYFTGMWPLHNGIYEFFNRTLQKPTIFEYAKNQGYVTIFQTDFPVILGPNLGLTNGIDYNFIEDEHSALKTLVKNKEKNTLSFFHFGGVHYPYGFHTLKFGGKDYVNKVRFLEKKYHISTKERQKPQDILDETFRNSKDTELLLRYKFIIQKLYRSKMYTDLFELYLEGINYFLQKRFEKFIYKLKKFVDTNNAVLFVFSDHGEEWDVYSEGHHNSLSDNVLRVPLIAYGKHIHPRIENKLIRTIDLAPTIMNLISHRFEKIAMDGMKLNLYNSWKNTSRDKYAISQVWISLASKQHIANYQHSVAESHKRVKPLNTYLASEVIRTLNKKLAIYYNKNGTIFKKESTTARRRVRKKLNLKRILIDYNSSKITGRNRISTIEIKIRNELNNLGYKV